jgi:hypothetical protein
VLILDALGTESATPWAREKLYQLINHRYNHRLATVFTSNVRLEQLDPRVASRMHDPALGACILTGDDMGGTARDRTLDDLVVLGIGSNDRRRCVIVTRRENWRISAAAACACAGA